MSKKESQEVPKVLATFGFGSEIGKGPDARTIIMDPKLGLRMMHYRILERGLECEFAGDMATELAQLMVSKDGKGREQNVESFKNTQQKTPKIIYEGEQAEP